jgi:hypothetical protein
MISLNSETFKHLSLTELSWQLPFPLILAILPKTFSSCTVHHRRKLAQRAGPKIKPGARRLERATPSAGRSSAG